MLFDDLHALFAVEAFGPRSVAYIVPESPQYAVPPVVFRTTT
jgi:hypothetical protein